MGTSQRDNESVLFAHKSIVRLFPKPPSRTDIFTYADTSAAPIWTTTYSDTSAEPWRTGVFNKPSSVDLNLYQPMGFYLNPRTFGTDQMPAVLRACLSWTSALDPNTVNYASFTRTLNSPGLANTFPKLANTPSHGLLLGSARDALQNMLDVVLRKSSDQNMFFQGIYNISTKTVYDDRARRFMIGLCESDYKDIPKYPNVCACIGRNGVLEKLRADTGNNDVRMMCQSSVCVNGGDGIYKLSADPPCTTVNICKPGLDIKAAKLSMSNVTFDCGTQESVQDTSTVSSASTTKTVVSLPGQNISAKKPMPQTTKIVIGTVSGTVFVAIVVIIVVLIVKHKKKTK
jgi:hypothetical protein